jgi:hypothetical protein
MIRRSISPAGNSRARGKGQAEEHKVFLRGDGLGHTSEILAGEFGAVDAEVGDGGGIGEVECDRDGMAGDRHGFSGSGVPALDVAEVGVSLEDNRGRVAITGGGIVTSGRVG